MKVSSIGGEVCPVQIGSDLEDVMEIPEDIEEEVEELRVAPSPQLPSASEYEEHRVTHYPYRAWCRFCDMCKALGEKRPGGSDGKTIPIVALDYFYITSGDVAIRGELELNDEELMEELRKGTIVKCLIVRCLETKAVIMP